MEKRSRRMPDIAILIGYVGLIYLTLPLTPKLFSFLSKSLGPNLKNILNVSLIGVVLFLFYIFPKRIEGGGWKTRLGLAAVLSIYIVILARYTPIIAEKVHLIEYGFLGYLVLRAFRESRLVKTRYICVIFIIAIVGYLDEVIQGLLPNRVYDVSDIYLNIISGLLGLILLKLLGYRDTSYW